jgi:hypothetical protein
LKGQGSALYPPLTDLLLPSFFANPALLEEAAHNDREKLLLSVFWVIRLSYAAGRLMAKPSSKEG